MSVTLTHARPATRRPVLAERLLDVRGRTAVLVVGGALLVAAASQVRIPLGFTPVPINLATFAAALTGGALGVRRGAAAMALYLAAGLVGLPFFAGAESGWTYATGATGGYLVCYPLLAMVVGAAARHGRDRSVVPCVAAVVVGNVALYAVGTAWLAHVLEVPVWGGEGSAFALGVRPFLAGDVVKMAAAGMLLPAAWRFVGRSD